MNYSLSKYEMILRVLVPLASLTNLEFGLFNCDLLAGLIFVFDNLYSFCKVFWPVVFDKLLALEVFTELMAGATVEGFYGRLRILVSGSTAFSGFCRLFDSSLSGASSALPANI